MKWQPVVQHLKDIGDYLKKLFANNPKNLGSWGFIVDDSPQKPALRTSKVKPGETVTNNSIIVGSTFTNTGTVDLHVYKGKTTTGTPSIVPPGEQLGMIKGFSTITVVNPNTLVAGKYSVFVSST